MKTAFIGLMACILSAPRVCSAGVVQNKTPVLIELFTSEGCSSCPPADAWLQQIDASQPIPGVYIVVLSEHVTYWNHDGWKDQYSRELYTDRQGGYVRSLGLSTPYTPQLVVNGGAELRLNEPRQMKQVLEKAASQPDISINISNLSVEQSEASVLRAHVEIDGSRLMRNGDVFAVVALDHVQTQVASGENAGKTLAHVAVAQQFLKIGKLEKKEVFRRDIAIKLEPNMNSQSLRLIVFIQEPNLGNILGTTLEKTTLGNKD